MTTRRRHRTLLAALAVSGLALGFLAGIATDRIRYDLQRAVVLAHYNQAAERLNQRLMALEIARGPRP
jgi:hypothetical protein